MAENNANNEPTPLPFDEEMCERYLLGELSDADQERFESAYFSDDVFFDRFMAVKNELIDLYSRRELDPARQEKVRNHFSATAPRRKQLADSEHFIQAVTSLSDRSGYKAPASELEPEPQPFFSFLKFSSLMWATAAVLLFTGVGIWWFSTRSPETEVAILQPTPVPVNTREITIPTPANTQQDAPLITAEPTANTRVDKPRQTEVPSTTGPTPFQRPIEPKTSGLQARLVLAAVATRDISDANTLRIYSDTPSVSIELSPPVGSYKNYTAAITTVSGVTHWQTKRSLRRVGKRLALQVDPRALKQSDYILTLTGVTPAGGSETAAEYYFHVVRDPQKTPSTESPK